MAQNIKQMMKTVTLPHLQASLQNDKVQNSYGVSEMLVCIVKCDGFKAVIDFVNQTNGGNVSFGNLMDIADNLESMVRLKTVASCIKPFDIVDTVCSLHWVYNCRTGQPDQEWMVLLRNRFTTS